MSVGGWKQGDHCSIQGAYDGTWAKVGILEVEGSGFIQDVL